MTSEIPGADFDEAGALKAFQRDARSIAKHLETLTKIKVGDPRALDELEKGLTSLPPAAELLAAIDELRGRAASIVASGRAARAEAIRRFEADFIRASRDAGQGVRESGNSAWRVGQIELDIQRERAQARVFYNKEVVVTWAPIAGPQDFAALIVAAEKRLAASALDQKEMPRLFWEAYEHLKRSAKPGAKGVRVPLRDFYREVRVTLTRDELAGKPDRKLVRAEFPLWAFLFNLDRYRKLLPTLGNNRLTFETGSQHDVQKGLSMVVNGLDANDGYKSYCYVYAEEAEKK
jgi:hypothetical protein